MKKTIRQADKQHNPNRLHDALIAAGLNPVVESTPEETYITIPDDKDAEAQAVIDGYTFQASPPSPNVKQLAVTFRDSVNAATNLAQIKTALSTDLMKLLKAMDAGYRDGNL